MDQNIATIIIAVITGLFSIITLVIQKKQDKVINKIDKQTKFLEKEKSLKSKLDRKEKELGELTDRMMVLILDTNLYILQNTNIADDSVPVEDLTKQCNELKDQFAAIVAEIEHINKEYAMLLELSQEFQESQDKKKQK